MTSGRTATLGSPALPLVGVDAVALDFETTGLDPGKARIVQVGAVRLRAGHIIADEVLDCLVAPGVPVPAPATAIHGLADADLAEAPSWPEVEPRLRRFVGDDLVIGHSIGFDLAIWQAESRRHGRAWTSPRSLCTRLLAEVAAPDLPGFSLEIVSAWLGLTPESRHSALGDAFAAARIFLALAGPLRERGVRTVAEADAATRRLAGAREDQVRAGWIEPSAPPTPVGLSRIDAYPFRHRVGAVMSRPAAIVPAGLSLQDAAAHMANARIGSLLLDARADDAVPPDRPRPAAQLSILTERDVLRAVAADGAAALQADASRVASRPVAVIPADAFVYTAIGRMARLRIRHLGVTDGEGRVVGMVSQRDLLRLRAEEVAILGDAIETADAEPTLARAWGRLPEVATRLRVEDVAALDVAAVISEEILALTRRAAEIAAERLEARGLGPAPQAFAILVLGSGGRGESLLSADQDNAIVFGEGEPGGESDRWFGALGEEMAAILDAAGLVFCKGGVMARNPAWRGSLATWAGRARSWIAHSRPDDLLSVDVFFDFRAAAGDARLVADLGTQVFAIGASSRSFLKLLAEAGAEAGPPLGLFGNIRTEGGRVDLKRGLLLPIVASARCLAIAHGIAARGTIARLEGLVAKGVGAAADLEALAGDLRLGLDLVLAQQVEDVAAGRPSSPAVVLKRLSGESTSKLRSAFRRVETLPHLVRDVLFA